MDGILKRTQNAKIILLYGLNYKELSFLIYPPAERYSKYTEPDLEYIFREMKKKYVTLMLL